MKKKGIALLLTMMFVILMSVLIGYTLKSVNTSARLVESEKFMYQNALFIEDVLHVLQNSQDLNNLAQDGTNEDLFTFLTTSGFVVLEYENVKLILDISSARSKFNLRDLNETNEPYLYEYFLQKSVRGEFVDILKDANSGLREDGIYRSALFDKHPKLFRDYVASQKHMRILEQFYINEYGDNSIKNVKLDKLFYYTPDTNTSIDLNYATSEVWELVAGVDEQRAKLLADSEVVFHDLNETGLSPEEIERVQNFKTSFFEPYLYIKMDIIKDNISSHVDFEYDIKQKKGYNFVFEI